MKQATTLYERTRDIKDFNTLLVPRQVYTELLKALEAVLEHFPTDTEMIEIGWPDSQVSEACGAYDQARAAVEEQL